MLFLRLETYICKILALNVGILQLYKGGKPGI